MKNIFISLVILTIFAGCSAKEFNDGVNSITGDVSKKFEDSKDKSTN